MSTFRIPPRSQRREFVHSCVPHWAPRTERILRVLGITRRPLQSGEIENALGLLANDARRLRMADGSRLHQHRARPDPGATLAALVARRQGPVMGEGDKAPDGRRRLEVPFLPSPIAAARCLGLFSRPAIEGFLRASRSCFARSPAGIPPANHQPPPAPPGVFPHLV